MATGFQQNGFQNNGFQIIGATPPPGSGSSSSQRRFPDLGFGFVGDSRPAEPHRKSFRPIWDRANDGAKVEQHAPAPKPFVPQPPPPSLFSKPQRAVIDLRSLPTFNQFVPHDLPEQGRQMEDMQDRNDALAALQAVLAKLH